LLERIPPRTQTRFLVRHYSRVRDMLRRDALWLVAWRALVRLVSPLGYLGLATMYQKDLTRPLIQISARADVRIAETTAEADLDQLTHLLACRLCEGGWASAVGPDLERQAREETLKRFRRGWKCFVAKNAEGQIVHFNWMAFHWAASIKIGGRFIVLGADEAYGADAYTVESWRGKGLHSAVLSQMLVFLQRVGYRMVYTLAEPENRSSWIAHERLGWQVRGTVLVFARPARRRSWVWCLRGRSDPFVEKTIAARD
jgi:RimJ/RimL family protein N-acetyltransferase